MGHPEEAMSHLDEKMSAVIDLQESLKMGHPEAAVSHLDQKTSAGLCVGFQAFRPFILTKDALQKQVFGAGYPSIPTMSIEEFYQQKVEDGTFCVPNSGPAR